MGGGAPACSTAGIKPAVDFLLKPLAWPVDFFFFFRSSAPHSPHCGCPHFPRSFFRSFCGCFLWLFLAVFAIFGSVVCGLFSVSSFKKPSAKHNVAASQLEVAPLWALLLHNLASRDGMLHALFLKT